MKGKPTTAQKSLALTKEEAAKKVAEQCLTELTAVLKKHNCILQVDFVKQYVLDKEMLQYVINVYKKG